MGVAFVCSLRGRGDVRQRGPGSFRLGQPLRIGGCRLRRCCLLLVLGLALAPVPLAFAAGHLFLAQVLLVVLRRHSMTAVFHWFLVGHVAESAAVVAGLAENFQQARAHAFARHLHKPQRGHFRDLVLGAVASEAFDQPAQHEVPVCFEHHIDEVDHNDPTDVAQPKLAHHFLGGLKVVFGDGFLKVPAASGEFSGIDVHHGHGFGAVDDK